VLHENAAVSCSCSVPCLTLLLLWCTSFIAAVCNLDMHAFYSAFLQTIRDDQLLGCQRNQHAPCSDPAGNNGSVADVVPFTIDPYGESTLRPCVGTWTCVSRAHCTYMCCACR
jgi:hypothetical protein